MESTFADLPVGANKTTRLLIFHKFFTTLDTIYVLPVPAKPFKTQIFCPEEYIKSLMFVIADFWFTLNSTLGSEKIIEEK